MRTVELRRFSRRRLVPALLALVLPALFAACSGKPHYAPGCYLNGAVNPATRKELEGLAERFYGLLRARHYEDAYAEASEQLRTRVDKNQVAQAWTSIAEILTIPQQVKTEEIAVAAFPEGTRGPQELQCIDPADTTGARKMMTTDQPLQAYLIQSADVNGTRFNYASIWFFEKNQWRLATFGAKPRTQLGHDWHYYLDEARQQVGKGNLRNGALLYNLAMDLLVPAPWVRPELLDMMQKEQRKIRVENLTAGRKLEWVATDSTVFHVYMVKYDVDPQQGLFLHFQYEVPVPADTTAVAAAAPKLANFIRATFPEYPEVFRFMAIEATAPNRQPVWAGTFPFKGN